MYNDLFTDDDVTAAADALIHAPLNQGPFGVDELSGLLPYDDLLAIARVAVAAVAPAIAARALRQAADQADDWEFTGTAEWLRDQIDGKNQAHPRLCGHPIENGRFLCSPPAGHGASALEADQ